MSKPIRTGLVLLILTLASAATPSPTPYAFHHDHILGTSLDLTVWTTSEHLALQAEHAILDEIDRLLPILSTYDPASEISRLNASRETLRCSAELIEVLQAYQTFASRSAGAYSPCLGELVALWQAAQRDERLPTMAELAPMVARLREPAIRIDPAARTVTPLSGQSLNIDSLGKAFIIRSAVARARAKVPAATGILLNIGGDMLIWGDAAARIAVANPRQPQDNAPALTQLDLRDCAVATSGTYERGYRINGRWYSHILDPRTGQPVQTIVGATVTARDNLTANALATTLCVLPPEQGIALVEQTPGAQALVVNATGEQFRTTGFALSEVAAESGAEPKSGWPKDYQLGITLTIQQQQGRRRAERPYVAIWAEDKDGKLVRNIAMWGNERKYFKDMPDWWKHMKERPELVRAVTRATRPPGRYQLAWDGLDDAGKPVPSGTYTIRVEMNREHGRHQIRDGKITCGDEQATGSVPAATDFAEVRLVYGPRAGSTP